VGQITFAQNGTTRMTTAKQYDYLNRLSSISSTPSNSFSYLYNSANQRTMDRLADGSYWRYGYDSLGQVISGNKYWNDETPVAGQQFDYDFDTIGNRLETEAGGDQNGENLRLASYTNNSLNQITGRSVPAYVDIMGDGIATNPVTVNGTTAYRKGEYFREQLGVTNSSAAVWDGVTVAENGGGVTGHVYVPETPESYTYDADGNLLSDGRWNYTWDGENRLISMTSLGGAPSGSQLQLNFAYDYQGRRIQKVVFTNNGSAYIGEYTNNYVYDGWNCVALLGPTLSLSNSFMWGSDLSETIQGAGGVGGLLAENIAGNGVQFVAYDGNGNVSALVNAANGVTVANYEYGPFGEVTRATGPMAKLNPFRFSTKYQDDETDLLYYGYRYYNPSTGRWLSRDPAENLPADLAGNRPEDQGGPNLYEFARNNALTVFDYLGLASADIYEFQPPVKAVLSDLSGWFSGLDEHHKRRQCRRLLQIGGVLSGQGAASAWDLEPLHTWDHTHVLFGGSCFYAGAVNYAEWGQTCKLCHDAAVQYGWMTYIPPAGVGGSGTLLPEAGDFTSGAASQDVMIWKAFMYLDFSSDMRLEALEFTAWGYNRTSPSVSLSNCCYNKSETYPKVTWVWAPGMPR
jgi:RHS repeat-associated protein